MNKFKFTIGYIILGALITWWHLLHKLPIYQFYVLAVPVYIMDFVIDTKEKYLAWVYVKRFRVALWVLLLCAALAGLSLWRHKIPLKEINIDYILPFIISGFLIGWVIRYSILQLFNKTIRGHEIASQRVYLMIALLIFFILMPIDVTHVRYLSVYMLGTGLGYFTHFAIRNKEHARALHDRYAQNLRKLIANNHEQLKEYEIKAIDFYSKKKWNQLKKLLTDNEENHTPILVIIEAAMHRNLGNYHEALGVINEEFEKPNRSDCKYDHLLYLHKSLNYSELNNQDEAMKSLSKALSNASLHAAEKDCMLARLTASMRLTEYKLPYIEYDNKHLNKTEQFTAHENIHKAIALHQSYKPGKPQAAVTGMSVVYTFTTLVDALGYVMLHDGEGVFARGLFTFCITLDPIFSSPYLHFAEWYIIATKNLDDSDPSYIERRKLFEKNAKLCLWITYFIEDKRHSNIRRRAISLMQTLKMFNE